jgi:hypothetical protein
MSAEEHASEAVEGRPSDQQRATSNIFKLHAHLAQFQRHRCLPLPQLVPLLLCVFHISMCLYF